MANTRVHGGVFFQKGVMEESLDMYVYNVLYLNVFKTNIFTYQKVPLGAYSFSEFVIFKGCLIATL